MKMSALMLCIKHSELAASQRKASSVIRRLHGCGQLREPGSVMRWDSGQDTAGFLPTGRRC